MASSEHFQECTLRVLEAVNKNSVSLFESARNNYSKIQLLNSLAEECNEEGETPLAIAIKSDCVAVLQKIMKFLIDELYNVYYEIWDSSNVNYRRCRDKSTFVISQFVQQISIKQLIDIVIHDPDGYPRGDDAWLSLIAKMVSESISLTRQDKIIFLELIGSALISKHNYKSAYGSGYSGLGYWREAMTLRHFPTDGGDPLPKLPNVLVPSESSSIIFGSAVEVSTIEELDLLLKRYQSPFMEHECFKPLLIQALLVVRRISAQEHLGHPHWFYLKSLLYYAAFVWNINDKFRIKTCLFTLEELNGFDPNLFPRTSIDVFIGTLDRLSDYFIKALSKPPNSPEGKDLNYANLLIITKLVTTIQPNHPHFQEITYVRFTDLLHVIYRLVFVLDSSRLTSEEQQKLEKFYYDYFRDFPERTTTVLHKAVSSFCYYSTNQHSLQTIQRILKFGADPNASDEFGQTPLHHLADSIEFTDEDQSVFQVLLDAGAHLDAAGDNGKTVFCILKEKLRGKVHPYFESLYNSVFPLTYLCARVIRRHGVPLDLLPTRLKKLVSSNSAKDY